ncbi:MAG: ROK family protein [Oscillospiraceae bacterium]|jgi:glucokinase|nr:ROK family protein [Oscillospiraceae bacterium]
MAHTCLAVDIGGSKLMVGLVDRAGHVLARERRVWKYLDVDSVMRDILTLARALLAAHPGLPSPVLAGVTIPGLADPIRGLWLEASFSGIRDLPIAALLREQLRLPVYVDNDGQACALAEKCFGACRDVDDFLYITVSNGIGGALFLAGRLYAGASGTAGELGHCTVVEDGRACKCGLRGCLEMHAAGPGIARNYAELGGMPLPADAAEIARRAGQGEQIALDTYALEGEYLGRSLAWACNLLNPAKVVLGGGVSLSFPLFAPALHTALHARLYRSANPTLIVEPTALGYDGGLLGAAAVAFCRHEGRYI